MRLWAHTGPPRFPYLLAQSPEKQDQVIFPPDLWGQFLTKGLETGGETDGNHTLMAASIPHSQEDRTSGPAGADEESEDPGQGSAEGQGQSA